MIKHTLEVKVSTLLIFHFIQKSLDEGVEFESKGEMLYPASSVLKALQSNQEVTIILPEKMKHDYKRDSRKRVLPVKRPKAIPRKRQHRPSHQA